jgi:hypothetical protein
MPQAAIACRSSATPKPKACAPRKFYRPRDNEASPFFKVVTSFLKGEVVALRALYYVFCPLFATGLTSSRACTRSVFSNVMDIGGRLSDPPSTSF